MKYGGVAAQPTSLPHYVALLRVMQATTVRVSMFLGEAANRRFDNAELDQLLGAGLTEMIIQSSERPSVEKCQAELGGDNNLIDYIRANRNTLFIYELGNEPDMHYADAHDARREILTTLRTVRPEFTAPNLLWAVNMPRKDAPDAYHFEFVRDLGDGLGPIIPGHETGRGAVDRGNVPHLITAHCYGFNTLCPTDGNDPNHVLDLIVGWNDTINVKVTEAGIFNRVLAESGERGKRYVDYGDSVLPTRYPNVDSLTFYTLGDASPQEEPYNLRVAEAIHIGDRLRAGIC